MWIIVEINHVGIQCLLLATITIIVIESKTRRCEVYNNIFVYSRTVCFYFYFLEDLFYFREGGKGEQRERENP